MKPKKSSVRKKTPSSLVSPTSISHPPPALGLAAREPRLVTRSALIRMEFIHEQLREVRPDNTVRVTRQSLAAALCRSRSLINEEIRQMREIFGAPIQWDSIRGTLYYARAPGQPPYQLHPRATVSQRGVLALLVSARRVFPFGASFVEMLRTVLPLINGGLTFDVSTLDTICSAPETPATEADLGRLMLLLEAIGRRLEVHISYGKLAPGAAPEARTLHPLHIVIFADSCLLVAHDPACHDRRNFELARIRDAQFTGTTFRPPADFDLAAYLAGGVDRFLGEARHEIRVRFAPALARYVEERPWQRGQLLEKLPDGSAEATYRVAHPKAIEQRVLAAGGLAEVLSPPDVRARIRAAAAAVSQANGGRPGDTTEFQAAA